MFDSNFMLFHILYHANHLIPFIKDDATKCIDTQPLDAE